MANPNRVRAGVTRPAPRPTLATCSVVVGVHTPLTGQRATSGLVVESRVIVTHGLQSDLKDDCVSRRSEFRRERNSNQQIANADACNCRVDSTARLTHAFFYTRCCSRLARLEYRLSQLLSDRSASFPTRAGG